MKIEWSMKVMDSWVVNLLIKHNNKTFFCVCVCRINNNVISVDLDDVISKVDVIYDLVFMLQKLKYFSSTVYLNSDLKLRQRYTRN